MDAERLCLECAGVAGLDPGPLTLRELDTAAEARQRAEWGRLLSLMWCMSLSGADRPPDPLDLVPRRYRPGGDAPPATPAARDRRVRQSWQALDAYAAQIAGG